MIAKYEYIICEIYILHRYSEVLKYYQINKRRGLLYAEYDINLVDKFCMRYEEGSKYAIGYLK